MLTELYLLHQISQDDPLLRQAQLPRAVKAGGDWAPSFSQGSCKSVFILSQPNTTVQQPQAFLSLSGQALELHVPSTASPSCLLERQNKGAERQIPRDTPDFSPGFLKVLNIM